MGLNETLITLTYLYDSIMPILHPTQRKVHNTLGAARKSAENLHKYIEDREKDGTTTPELAGTSTVSQQTSKHMGLNLLQHHLPPERFLKVIDEHDQQAKKNWGFGKKTIGVEAANTLKNDVELAQLEFRVRNCRLY